MEQTCGDWSSTAWAQSQPYPEIAHLAVANSQLWGYQAAYSYCDTNCSMYWQIYCVEE